jgi:small subunit ribosomal protein S8
MAINDPIADMLTRIRNAGHAKMKSVDMPASKIKAEIAKLFKIQGFIKNYKLVKDNRQGILRVYLKYTDQNEHVIRGLERISKPSRREYLRSKDVKPVLSGMGLSVLSTSKGIMTDKQARQENVGGEILCNVW